MTEQDQKNEALFMQLVFTFQTAAYQQMGKIKNPLTDQVERDLNQARFSIDMLNMIRTKTQGHLSENEKIFLDRVISELQLNFVAEMEKGEKEPSSGEDTVEEKPKGETKEEIKGETPSEDAGKPGEKATKKKTKKSPKKK